MQRRILAIFGLEGRPTSGPRRAATTELLFRQINPRIVALAEDAAHWVFGPRGAPTDLVTCHIRWGGMPGGSENTPSFFCATRAVVVRALPQHTTSPGLVATITPTSCGGRNGQIVHATVGAHTRPTRLGPTAPSRITPAVVCELKRPRCGLVACTHDLPASSPLHQSRNSCSRLRGQILHAFSTHDLPTPHPHCNNHPPTPEWLQTHPSRTSCLVT